MKNYSKVEIEQKAHDALIQLWNFRKSQLGGEPELGEFFRTAPERYVLEILKMKLDRRESIEGTVFDGEEAVGRWRAGGYADRSQNTIGVAQKHPEDWKRFTLAHEIAHILLHSDEISFRDQILNGAERAGSGRPFKEMQADWFAAAFLMPSKRVRSLFATSLGKVFDTRNITPEQLYWLENLEPSRNGGRRDFSRRELSMSVARMRAFEGRVFVPLYVAFGVTITTMAIRLEELCLVV